MTLMPCPSTQTSSCRVGTVLVVVAMLMLVGCQPLPYGASGVHLNDAPDCEEIRSRMDVDDRIGTLRNIAHAFNQECYELVLDYGSRAQSDYRYKQFSVLRETSSIFFPDGELTEYVLESYERGFLTFLLAASHYQLNNIEGSRVELRRLDHEIITLLYNYGEDPINILLGAVMWETLGEPYESRVDWNRLSTQHEQHAPVAAFAFRRMHAIDAGQGAIGPWSIYAIGNFPEVEWDLQFTGSNNGYFSVTPAQRFGEDCASDTGVRISTQPWFTKIALRHSGGYHPLLNAQSWLRLPFGVAYSITTFAAGASIAIGGCAIDLLMEGNGALCEVSLNGGVALMKESPHVLRHILQPDLRHWDNVPLSFLFTTVFDIKDEVCFSNLTWQERRRTNAIFHAHVRTENSGEANGPSHSHQ